MGFICGGGGGGRGARKCRLFLQWLSVSTRKAVMVQIYSLKGIKHMNIEMSVVIQMVFLLEVT